MALVGGGRPHLLVREAAHGHVAVVADLQQRHAEAPLVGRVPHERSALDALWGYPWDAFQTFWGRGGRGGGLG